MAGIKSKVLCFGELLVRISPAASHAADKQPMQPYVGDAAGQDVLSVSHR